MTPGSTAWLRSSWPSSASKACRIDQAWRTRDSRTIRSPVEQAGHDHLRPRRHRHPQHPGVFNFKDNTHLDESGFTPFGEVVEGLDVMDEIYAGYGELPPAGNGRTTPSLVPGEQVSRRELPEMTKVNTATLVEAGA